MGMSVIEILVRSTLNGGIYSERSLDSTSYSTVYGRIIYSRNKP